MPIIIIEKGLALFLLLSSLTFGVSATLQANKDKDTVVTNEIRIVDPDSAFEKCFNTDKEREQYMYMYSIKNTHYFKNTQTRMYIKINKNGL